MLCLASQNFTDPNKIDDTDGEDTDGGVIDEKNEMVMQYYTSLHIKLMCLDTRNC